MQDKDIGYRYDKVTMERYVKHYELLDMMLYNLGIQVEKVEYNNTRATPKTVMTTSINSQKVLFTVTSNGINIVYN